MKGEINLPSESELIRVEKSLADGGGEISEKEEEEEEEEGERDSGSR